jgi:hypothetical protein
MLNNRVKTRSILGESRDEQGRRFKEARTTRESAIT